MVTSAADIAAHLVHTLQLQQRLLVVSRVKCEGNLALLHAGLLRRPVVDPQPHPVRLEGGVLEAVSSGQHSLRT